MALLDRQGIKEVSAVQKVFKFEKDIRGETYPALVRAAQP